MKSLLLLSLLAVSANVFATDATHTSEEKKEEKKEEGKVEEKKEEVTEAK
jgi:hypothetical protein